ncbi:hypothetical protein FHS81_002693 [Pseudochelatococcus contaminans]|uniref:Uncharacterized protein n=1 Tax=Pseudochelatococcus contaminans TaxID=1538103 RepID=A0A7W6EI01_9HYPH|nr:hypothetical protein [Pseudochelatococcus contaminans]
MIASVQIGRGSNRKKADVATHPDDQHILRNGFGEPHAGIEARLDDIDKPAIADDIELDIRILGQEPGRDLAKH